MSRAVAARPDMLDAARELVWLKERYYAAVRLSGEAARVDELTAVELDAVLATGQVVEDACEDFRRRYFPRAGRVVCALGMVCVASPTGRRTRVVYDADSRVD